MQASKNTGSVIWSASSLNEREKQVCSTCQFSGYKYFQFDWFQATYLILLNSVLGREHIIKNLAASLNWLRHYWWGLACMLRCLFQKVCLGTWLMIRNRSQKISCGTIYYVRWNRSEACSEGAKNTKTRKYWADQGVRLGSQDRFWKK